MPYDDNRIVVGDWILVYNQLCGFRIVGHTTRITQLGKIQDFRNIHAVLSLEDVSQGVRSQSTEAALEAHTRFLPGGPAASQIAGNFINN